MSSKLHGVIKQSQERRVGMAKRRIIDLPTNVVTAARLHKFLRGGDLRISSENVHHVKEWEGTALFGGGFVVPESVAALLQKRIDED